jgi:hypothetical protein
LRGKPQSIISKVEPNSTNDALPLLPLASDTKRNINRKL